MGKADNIVRSEKGSQRYFPLETAAELEAGESIRSSVGRIRRVEQRSGILIGLDAKGAVGVAASNHKLSRGAHPPCHSFS